VICTELALTRSPKTGTRWIGQGTPCTDAISVDDVSIAARQLA